MFRADLTFKANKMSLTALVLSHQHTKHQHCPELFCRLTSIYGNTTDTHPRLHLTRSVIRNHTKWPRKRPAVSPKK